MKCPGCIKEGKKSKVFELGSYKTLMGSQTYYDEDGKFHSHDPNQMSTQYRCTNGHMFRQTRKADCPTCGSDW